MRTISVRYLQKPIQSAMEAAQNDQVVITRSRQPVAVLIGVEAADWATVAVETNPSFWKAIAQRRTQETVSLAEIRKRLEAWPSKLEGNARGRRA